MKVAFLHPRTSIAFQAEVDRDTTGQTCLDNLVGERFVEAAPANRPYAMVVQRTHRQLLPNMTMQEGGVQDNDALAILQQEQGAAYTRATRASTDTRALRSSALLIDRET